jgi:TP901 family phage tail tape measure protein
MTKIKDDISRVSVQVDGKQAINELGKLEMEAKQLSIDMKTAKKGTDDYVNASKKHKEVTARINEQRKALGLTGMTMSQLQRYQKDLANEMNKTTTRGTARYNELKNKIQEVNQAIRNQREELNGTAGFFGKIGKEIKAFGVLALGYLGVDAFFGQIQSLISGSAKLSDELSDVQKTTGLTDQELQKLSKTLNEINTRTSRSELRSLAEIAGRLGITSVKDIEGFVRAADKINVALGDSLGEPEQVMRELGKLTETFGTIKEFGIENALLKVGSAINELGMASTASEGYMVEFAKRLSGVAPLAKISIQDVLGLGATLDSLGQTSEVSSTALSKLFLDMAKNAKVFSKQAKMEYGDFVKLLNTDANEAFIRVLEGVKGNSAGLTELAATLGDVGADGGRVVGVLGTLANNTEKLREQQIISNKAFKDGTSIIDEFDLKNKNFAANLEKVQKWMAGLFVNNTIMNGLNSFVELWADFVEIPISKTIEDERIELNKLYIQIISANTSARERITLINKLKETYPGFLKNIEADKVSNTQLAAAIKATNEQLVNKIILQEQDEKIQKQAKFTARATKEMLDNEGKLRGEMIKIAEKYNLKIFEGLSLEEQALSLYKRAQSFDKPVQGRDGQLINTTGKLNDLINQYRGNLDVVNTLTQKGNVLTNEREQLMKRLGITLEETGSSLSLNIPDDPNANNDTSNIVDTEAPQVLNETLDKMADAWQKYQAKILGIQTEFDMKNYSDEEKEKFRAIEKYTALLSELRTFKESELITIEEYNIREAELDELYKNEISAINQIYEEKRVKGRADAERKISEVTMSERELTEQKVNESFDALVNLANQYGLDTIALEEARQARLQEIKDDYRKRDLEKERTVAQAKIELAQNLSMVLGEAINFIGMSSGNLTGFQKVLAVAQIAIDSAVALSKVPKLSAESASGTGPAAPFVFAANLAAMTGIVLGGIAKAKNVLTQANVPSFTPVSAQQAPTRGRSDASSRKSYYFGGATGGGLGFGDKYGEFAGYVHQKEYVIPSMVTSDPWVANLLPAIESIRKDKVRGFYNGGATTAIKGSSPAGGMADEETKALLRMMVAKLDMMPKQIKAYLVYNDLEKMQTEMETLKNRYKA